MSSVMVEPNGELVLVTLEAAPSPKPSSSSSTDGGGGAETDTEPSWPRLCAIRETDQRPRSCCCVRA